MNMFIKCKLVSCKFAFLGDPNLLFVPHQFHLLAWIGRPCHCTCTLPKYKWYVVRLNMIISFSFLLYLFIAGTFNIISLFNIIASRKLIKTDQDKMQQKNLQKIVKICK